MFSKVLVANRGVIACRILRTLKKMGIASVAVYSEADREARHVLDADEAVFLGSSAASESYLAIDRVLAAAQTDRCAKAIHPGYGFLSENVEFATEMQAARHRLYRTARRADGSLFAEAYGARHRTAMRSSAAARNRRS